jgi:hypothetical protein
VLLYFGTGCFSSRSTVLINLGPETDYRNSIFFVSFREQMLQLTKPSLSISRSESCSIMFDCNTFLLTSFGSHDIWTFTKLISTLTRIKFQDIEGIKKCDGSAEGNSEREFHKVAKISVIAGLCL